MREHAGFRKQAIGSGFLTIADDGSYPLPILKLWKNPVVCDVRHR
jgi:hypothetical protein